MRLPELKKIDSEDPKVNKFQGYVKDQFELINWPAIRGRYLTRILNGVETNIMALTTTATNFEHKLGREPEGFVIVYQDAAASIFWDRTSTEDRTLFIRLDSSANVNAKVWVF